jgi:hypothetical protein
MARSRNIKPAFFDNELLGALPSIDRLAFIALWTVADYKGCLEYRPIRLKHKLLPYDDCNFEEIIEHLEGAGFVKTYSYEDNRYIKILNFTIHQNPHIKEKNAGSKIPDLDIKTSSVLAPNKIGTNHADSLLLIPDTLKPHPEPLKERGDGLIFGSINDLDIQPFDMSNVISIEDLMLNQDFESFWTNYPKRTKKEDAMQAWIKIKPDLDIVLQALKWQKETKEWQKENGQYVPSARNYILDRRWTDELPEPILF